jgi:hypothetical protein
MSPETVGAPHPMLTLAVVYATMPFSQSHRAEIHADIDADDRFVAAQSVKADGSLLQERLAGLRAKDDPLSPG